MRRRVDFKAAVTGKAGLYNIELELDSPQIGIFRIKLRDLNLSDEEQKSIINAEELEGTVYYSAITKENNGVLKVLELRPVGTSAPEHKVAKSLSKQFNGKVVMELDDMNYTMVVETETLGTLHIPTRNLGLVFEQYQAMREKGVTGTYEIEDIDNDMNTKKIKVTGLKPKA